MVVDGYGCYCDYGPRNTESVSHQTIELSLPLFNPFIASFLLGLPLSFNVVFCLTLRSLSSRLDFCILSRLSFSNEFRHFWSPLSCLFLGL